MWDFVLYCLLYLCLGTMLWLDVKSLFSGVPNAVKLLIWAFLVAFALPIIKFLAVCLVFGAVVQVVSWFVGKEKMEKWLDETS